MANQRTRAEALAWIQAEMRRLDAGTHVPVTVMRREGPHSYGVTRMIRVRPRRPKSEGMGNDVRRIARIWKSVGADHG